MTTLISKNLVGVKVEYNGKEWIVTSKSQRPDHWNLVRKDGNPSDRPLELSTFEVNEHRMFSKPATVIINVSGPSQLSCARA